MQWEGIVAKAEAKLGLHCSDTIDKAVSCVCGYEGVGVRVCVPFRRMLKRVSHQSYASMHSINAM